MSHNPSHEIKRRSIIEDPDRKTIKDAFNDEFGEHRVLPFNKFKQNLGQHEIHANVQECPNNEHYGKNVLEHGVVATPDEAHVVLFSDPRPDGRDPSIIMTGPHTSDMLTLLYRKIKNIEASIHNHSFEYAAYNEIIVDLENKIKTLYLFYLKFVRVNARGILMAADSNPELATVVPNEVAYDVLSKNETRAMEREFMRLRVLKQQK